MKKHFWFIAAYLVFVLMGTCTFMAADSLHARQAGKSRYLAEFFLASRDYMVDDVTTDSLMVSKVRGGPSSFSPHYGAVRIFLSGRLAAAINALCSPSWITAIAAAHHSNSTNTILLKLRI